MKLPEDAKDVLVALARRARACTVDTAARYFVVAAWKYLEDGTRLLNGESMLEWSDLLNRMIKEVAPSLFAQCRPDEPGAEDRFYGALLFALEMGSMGAADAVDEMYAIAAGTLDLDSALRARKATDA